MAEFCEVMRQWRRMCVTMDKKHGEHACGVCALNGCTAVYDSDGTEDYADIERKVTAWAAEHPEPVYPKWLEWLHTTSAVDDTPDIPVGDGIFRVAIKNEPMPADIAKKLGIEPKEG